MESKKFFYGWYIAAACTLLGMNSNGVTNVLGVFFPALVSEYGFTATQVSGISSCITLGMLTATLTLGDVFRTKNTRVIVLIFGVILSAALASMFFAKNLMAFYIVGYVAGFGMIGVGFVTIPVLITKWFDSKRSTAMGIAVLGSNFAGIFLAPLFTYTLYTIKIGANKSFLIWGAVSIACILIVYLIIRDKPESISLKPYGHNYGEPKPDVQESMTNRNVGFSLQELLKMPEFYGLCLVYFIIGLSIQGVLVQVVPHLRLEGYTQAMATSIVVMYSMCTIVGKPIFGMTIDKIGVRKASACGTFCWGIAIACLYFAGTNSIFIYAFAIFTGIGSPFAQIAPPVWVSSMFGYKYYASNFSILMFTFTLGIAVGPLFTGVLRDMTGAFRFPIAILAILVFCTIPLLLMVHKRAVKKLDILATQ